MGYKKNKITPAYSYYSIQYKFSAADRQADLFSQYQITAGPIISTYRHHMHSYNYNKIIK